MHSIMRWLTGAALLSVIQPLTAAEPPLSASAAESVSRFVATQMTNVAPPTLAVFPFCHEDGSKSMEGTLLMEQILTVLSTNRTLRLVEREHLAKALEEQKLGLEGFLAPDTAVRAGRVTGARAILAGTLTEVGENVLVHARLYSVESGEILAVCEVRSRRALKAFINPLWDEIDRIKATGKRFEAKVWMTTERPRIGDTATVRFRTDRDCYVTIFVFSTDGATTVLFPNRFHPQNHVKMGREYQVPAEGEGYKIRVRGPAGAERVRLLATSEDISLYEKDYSQAPFSTWQDGDQELLRGLKAVLEPQPKTDWADATFEYLIENVLR